MKALELRLGNYVFKDGVVVKVDGRSIFDISNWEYDAEFLSPYEPIPLTEEWLDKLGFHKLWHLNRYEYVLPVNSNVDIEISERYYNNILKLRLNLAVDTDEMYPDGPTSVNYVYLYHIEYIHQLQNLFFCLCGEELTIVSPEKIQPPKTEAQEP